MKYFKYTFYDDTWVIYLTDHINLRELFTEHDEEFDADKRKSAFVDPSKKEIYFDESELTLVNVKHELTHVIFAYLYLDNTGFNSSQLEELCCDLMANRSDWLLDKADKVYKQLLILKDETDE